MFDIDYRELVSRGDLDWTGAVPRDEGLPVGNGTMGTCLWTTPSALHMQINRTDVFTCNCETVSFPKRHTDYGNACAFMDVDFVDFGPAALPDDTVRQHLGIYDAMATISGDGVSVRALAWVDDDVMAVEVTDARDKPIPIRANLRMLRNPVFRKIEHTAESELHEMGGRIGLTQRFTEGEFHCASAVAVGLLDRAGQVKRASDTEVRLAAAAGAGTFTILIASAATFDRDADVLAVATAKLDAAGQLGFAGLLERNRAWWRDFWSRSFVRLTSDDGSAERIEAVYTYYQYIMAASSRGPFPPRYGGMIWCTGGDYREWGSQFWWNNEDCYYHSISATDRPELLEPLFNMHTLMADRAATAARQQFGSAGLFIPETVWFDGVGELPEDIAEEMALLYTERKPWEDRSERFRQFAYHGNPHSTRWNWKDPGQWVEGRWTYVENRGAGCFGMVTHMFGGMGMRANIYWKHYEHTQDVAWLREAGYPMIKGTVEFFRNYPTFAKDTDGKYHIDGVNVGEGLLGCRDGIRVMATMHCLLPRLIAAAELLDVDAELLPVWRECLANLAPLPKSTDPDAIGGPEDGALVWVPCRKPVRQLRFGRYTGGSLDPACWFDLCGLETAEEDPETFALAKRAYDLANPAGLVDKKVSVLSRAVIIAAKLGRAEDVKLGLLSQMFDPHNDWCNDELTGHDVMANRMTLREGVNDPGAQRLGNACHGLQLALCQSMPATAGRPNVIRLFGALPAGWNADFKLLCRDGFLVAASVSGGVIECVKVHSRHGLDCRIRNPWSGESVTIRCAGHADRVSGDGLLVFPTKSGETYELRPVAAK